MSKMLSDPAARREGLKLFFETVKHLTTVAASALVFLAAFIKDPVSSPLQRAAMVGAFGGFVISVCASIVAMLSTARTIRRNETSDQLPDTLGSLSFWTSVFGFVIAMSALGLLGIARVLASP